MAFELPPPRARAPDAFLNLILQGEERDITFSANFVMPTTFKRSLVAFHITVTQQKLEHALF